MALSHLVDTSVLTRLRQPVVREAIESMTERGELPRAGISALEIGYAARNAAEWDRLADALRVFELVETTTDQVPVQGGEPHSRRQRDRDHMDPGGMAGRSQREG